MTDYYHAAKSAWQSAENNKWAFAEAAAYVAGIQTRELADDLKISVSTVENYRNAYELYYKLCQRYETSETFTMRDQLYVSIFWVAARAVRKYQLTPDAILEHLRFARDEKLSVDQFGAHVDNVENKTPAWIRRIESIVRTVKKLMDDYKSELPLEKQERAHEIFSTFAKDLQELAE